MKRVWVYSASMHACAIIYWQRKKIEIKLRAPNLGQFEIQWYFKRVDHFGLNMSQWQQFESQQKKAFLLACRHVALVYLLEIIDCKMWFMVIMVLTKSYCLCCPCVYAVRLYGVYRFSILLRRLSFHLLFICAICMQMWPIQQRNCWNGTHSEYMCYPGVSIAPIGSLLQIKSFLNCSQLCACTQFVSIFAYNNNKKLV